MKTLFQNTNHKVLTKICNHSVKMKSPNKSTNKTNTTIKYNTVIHHGYTLSFIFCHQSYEKTEKGERNRDKM